MAYAILDKSGCIERKGNVKVRLDFYLESDDPRYSDTYLQIIDVTSAEYLAGYPGKVDAEGNPLDEVAYQAWLDSLPRVWQLVPFHSHFVHLAPDFTNEDIKAEITFHLPNFYKAFQEKWDEVNGGMRHGWASETRIKPTDYSKSESAEDYAFRVVQCQARIDELVEFSFKPEAIGEGKEYPATEIDIGPGAIDRISSWPPLYTVVDLANPANDTGTIDTFEVWALTTMDGTNKVGTFHGSGTNYTNRDGEVIGTVTSGAKRTFTGLSIDVTTGDFAGIYWSAGDIEPDTSGGANIYYKSGDQFGTGEQTYILASGYAISIYGTGETVGGWTNISHVRGIAAASISHKKGVAVADISHVKGVAV